MSMDRRTAMTAAFAVLLSSTIGLPALAADADALLADLAGKVLSLGPNGEQPQPASSVREAAAERIRADRLRKFFMVYSPLAKLCFVFPYIYPIGSAGGEVKETVKK